MTDGYDPVEVALSALHTPPPETLEETVAEIEAILSRLGEPPSSCRLLRRMEHPTTGFCVVQASGYVAFDLPEFAQIVGSREDAVRERMAGMYECIRDAAAKRIAELNSIKRGTNDK